LRQQLFTHGPGPFADRLRAEGVDLMVGAHFSLLDSCLGDLVQAGFRPTQATMDALQKSFTEHLVRLANEAAIWITRGGDSRTLVEECATDVICTLAVLYELLPRGSGITEEETAAMMARLAMAGQIVGTQETVLTFARMGLVDEIAKARANREAAQEVGRQGARRRASKADQWRVGARSDWRAYTGSLSKTAWAKRYASKYDRAWRAVYGAISGAGEK